MEIQQLLSLLFRWLHIVPAIILVGGTLFLRFSWVPAAQEAGANDEIREAIRRRWARLVMLSVLCLLISGLYNIHDKATHYKMDGAYLALLGIKILLALFVFYLAAIISGRSQTAIRFREKEVFWLNVLCVAMIGIVCIAGYLKVEPPPKKEKLENQSGPVSIWISPVTNEWLVVHHVDTGRRQSEQRVESWRTTTVLASHRQAAEYESERGYELNANGNGVEIRRDHAPRRDIG